MGWKTVTALIERRGQGQDLGDDAMTFKLFGREVSRQMFSVVTKGVGSTRQPRAKRWIKPSGFWHSLELWRASLSTGRSGFWATLGAIVLWYYMASIARH